MAELIVNLIGTIQSCNAALRFSYWRWQWPALILHLLTMASMDLASENRMTIYSSRYNSVISNIAKNKFFPCPQKCICKDLKINCSYNALTRVPFSFAALDSIENLDLQGNNITVISKRDFNYMAALRVLYLSNDGINKIEAGAFRDLVSLERLKLNDNHIRFLPNMIFSNMLNLKQLDLGNNEMTSVGQRIFQGLVSLEQLNLEENPLYCDCNLRWLSEWVKRDYIETVIAHCAEPSSMRYKDVLTTPVSHFQCKSKYSARTEEVRESAIECIDCSVSAYQNHPRYEHLSPQLHNTTSVPHFHKWQNKSDACYANPCRNLGVCRSFGKFEYRCECLAGYTGLQCETNINDCTKHKCKNQATCIDLVESYRCSCPSGFTGIYCETPVNLCTKKSHHCANGEHCNSRSCDCFNSSSGIDCIRNIDECSDHLCQNGATCIADTGSYKCSCPLDYGGKYCELISPSDLLYPQTSPCSDHDCKNGVCFLRSPGMSSDYECHCKSGYTGKRCEYMTCLSFNHESIVQLQAFRTIPEVNLTIIFTTSQPNGVLLYGKQNNGKHLAVELFNGQIRVSYYVGNHPPSTIYSSKKLSDGEKHKAEILVGQKNITMEIDENERRFVNFNEPKGYLNFTSPIYVGGIAAEAASTAFIEFHLRNISSFKGCVFEMWINQKIIDFNNAVEIRGVSPGCSRNDLEEIGATLKNGNDISNDMQAPNIPRIVEVSSIRKTAHSYSDSCQKKYVVGYYITNSCQSRRFVRRAKCLGKCNNGCCSSNKVKKRKIRLVCSDGTRFTKEVKFIRRCQCSGPCK